MHMQQALTLMMVFNGDDGDCDDDGNCGDDDDCDDDDNNNDADGNNNYCQHNKQNQAQETKMTLNTDNGDSDDDDDDDGDASSAVHCSKPTWVVGGLFDELQVKLVAQEVTFQTLEHHVLHHRHVILVCVR